MSTPGRYPATRSQASSSGTAASAIVLTLVLEVGGLVVSGAQIGVDKLQSLVLGGTMAALSGMLLGFSQQSVGPTYYVPAAVGANPEVIPTMSGSSTTRGR